MKSKDLILLILSLCSAGLLLIVLNTSAKKNALVKQNQQLLLLNDSLASESKLAQQQVLYFLKMMDSSGQVINLPGEPYFVKDTGLYEAKYLSEKQNQQEHEKVNH